MNHPRSALSLHASAAQSAFSLAVALTLFAVPGCKGNTAGSGVGSAADGGAGSASTTAASLTPGPNPSKELAGSIFKLLPRKTAALVVFPSLETTGPRASAQLERVAKALGERGKVEGLMRALALGLINPFDAASRARWGVDGKRPAAFALDETGKSMMLAVRVRSFAVFDGRMKEKVSPAQVTLSQAGSTSISTVTRAGGAGLAYAAKDGHVLLVGARAGLEPRARLEALLKTEAAASLATAPTFLAAAGRLSSLDDLLVYFDGEGLYHLQARDLSVVVEGEHLLHLEVKSGGPVTDDEKRSLRRVFDAAPALAASLRLTDRDAFAQAYVAFGQPASWAPLFASAPAPLAPRFVDPGAIAALRVSLEGGALYGKLLSLDPALKNALAKYSADLEKRLGVHLERDLLKNLTGKATLAFLGFEKDLVTVAIDQARRSETLSRLHLVLAAEVKDKTTLEKMLASAKQLLDLRSASNLGLIEKSHAAGKYYELLYKGRVALSAAVIDETLLLTVGAGRMEKTLALVLDKVKVSATNELTQALVAPAPITFGMAFAPLLASLRALDFGPPGSRGAVLRKLVNERLEPLLGAFGDLAGQVRFDGAGVRLELVLRGK